MNEKKTKQKAKKLKEFRRRSFPGRVRREEIKAC